MKPTHYHTTFTFSAVTLHADKGDLWTSDGYKASSIDLKPISDLIGRTVERGGWTGHIKDILTDAREVMDERYVPTSGRYIDGKFVMLTGRYIKGLKFFNAQIGICWDNNSDIKNCPMPPYWNDFKTLNLIDSHQSE